LGYGLLSPAAGWLLAGVPLGWRTIVTCSLIMATALSVFFLGQVFQAEEDRRRRDRTLVATHGPRAVVTATRLCLWYAGIGVVILSLIGAFPRSCLLAMPVWVWLERWLVGTSRREILQEAHARVFVRRLGLFGLALLLCATGSYLADLYVGGPAAGQATVFRAG
jgi:1,4-dihydroxy-2-naphthoate octaprenyltransferase